MTTVSRSLFQLELLLVTQRDDTTSYQSSTTFSLAAIAKRFDTPSRSFWIKPSMGNQQIINTLRSGNTPIQVVFNNQQTVEHLVGRVAEQLEIDSLVLLNEIKVNVSQQL